MKKKIEFFFAWFLDVSLGGLGVPAAFPPPSHRFAPPPPPPAAATSREYEIHQQVKKYKYEKTSPFFLEIMCDVWFFFWETHRRMSVGIT